MKYEKMGIDMLIKLINSYSPWKKPKITKLLKAPKVWFFVKYAVGYFMWC
jgi:hypothetical protein